jgi:hypothetical protein
MNTTSAAISTACHPMELLLYQVLPKHILPFCLALQVPEPPLMNRTTTNATAADTNATAAPEEEEEGNEE